MTRSRVNREAAQIGRAFAASPLAAKGILASKVVEMTVKMHRFGPINDVSGGQLPVPVEEYVAGSGARRYRRYNRRRHHDGSRNSDIDAERNARCSEHRATRQKQSR